MTYRDDTRLLARDWPQCSVCDAPLTGQKAATDASAEATRTSASLADALNGGVSMCAYCGNVTIIVVDDHAVTLRPLTAHELAELHGDDEFLAAYQALGHDVDRLTRAFWTQVGAELEQLATGDPQARAEHLAWCKARALPYADAGDRVNMMSSLVVDLGQSPETQPMVGAAMLALYDLAVFSTEPRPDILRRWLDAFCPETA